MIDPDYLGRMQKLDEKEKSKIPKGLSEKELERDYNLARNIWDLTEFPSPEEVIE